MIRDTQKMRDDLRDGNKLLQLLDDYRKGIYLDDYHKELIWLGVSDFCYHLSKKHYGEPQKTRSHGEISDEHATRIDTVLEFILQSSIDIPIKGVVYSIHRRYAWIELLVEFKVAGISYLDDLTTTKKVNSSITKDIIIGIKIERKLTEAHNGRIPTEREVIVEFTRQLLDKGKTVSYACIERFSERYSAYKAAKNRTNTISFDESYFRVSPEVDSDI